MELRELRYFVAVSERLHYRRAAEHLGITQPALTNAIKRLEKEIGCRLLERSKKRQVRLTPAGQAFLEGVQRTLAESARAIERAQASMAGTAGALSIGHTEDFVSDILPRTLTKFTSIYPEVNIDLVQGASYNLPDLLLRGALDCVFETTPVPLALSNCESCALQPTPLIVLASANHSLARREAIRIGDLADQRFLHDVSREVSPFDKKVQSILSEEGLRIETRLTPLSANLVLELVATGQYLAFATIGSLPSGINGVKKLKMDHPDANLGRALIWKKENTNPTLQNFINSVQ